MRPLKKYFAIALSLGLFVNVSAQEYDDMYFTKKDRKSKFTNETYNETSSFSSADVEPVKITKQEDLAMNSYSAKTINPDYIAKYKSDALDEGADPASQEEYYIEQQEATTANATAAPVRYTNRRNNINWNWGLSYGVGYSSWNTWGYNPYSYWGPYSSFYLSSWYNPYGFNRWNRGWNSWNTGWNSWNNGWGNAYGDPYWNNFGPAWGGPAGFGPGPAFAGGWGGLYCPPGYYGTPVIINNNTFVRNGSNVDNRQGTRPVTVVNNGPRTSRNSTATSTQSGRQYRSTASGSASSGSGYVPITTSAPNTRTAVANPQGSYYRRANNPGTSVRTSQRSRVAVISGQSLNEAATSGRSSYTSNTRSSSDRSAAAYNYNSGRGRSSIVNTSSRSTSRSTVGSRPASAATRSYSTRPTSRTSSYNRSSSNSRSSFGTRSSGSSSYSRGSSRSSSVGSYSSGGSRGSVSSGSRSSGGSSRSSGGGGRRGN